MPLRIYLCTLSVRHADAHFQSMPARKPPFHGDLYSSDGVSYWGSWRLSWWTAAVCVFHAPVVTWFQSHVVINVLTAITCRLAGSRCSDVKRHGKAVTIVHRRCWRQPIQITHLKAYIWFPNNQTRPLTETERFSISGLYYSSPLMRHYCMTNL